MALSTYSKHLLVGVLVITGTAAYGCQSAETGGTGGDAEDAGDRSDSAPDRSENLLANPGFEEGTQPDGCPVEWTCVTYEPSEAGEFATDQAVTRNHQSSVRWSGTEQPGTVVKQRVASEPGRRYEVSVWVRGDGLESPPFLHVLFDRDGELQDDQKFSADGTVGEWTRITGQTRAAPPGTDELRFNLSAEQTAGTIWWDDALLVARDRVDSGADAVADGGDTVSDTRGDVGDAADTDGTTAPVIGGGEGYPHTVTRAEATTVVGTRSDLVAALESASEGDTVFVEGEAEIDLTGLTLTIDDGVTLASDRGIDGSNGALLYVDEDIDPTFIMKGASRFTGLEFRGAHPGVDLSGTWYGEGIKPEGPAEIDNNELRGFGVAAIEAVKSDGGPCHVHHNYIHHNTQNGRGYGVSVLDGADQPVIEYNYFNYNRHSITTDGYAHGYVARYNHIGPDSIQNPIDAHGQDADFTPAGVEFEVHNNIVEVQTRRPPNDGDSLTWNILIRGIPENDYYIHGNWLWNPNKPDPSGPSNVDGDELAITQSAFDGNQPRPFENVTFESNYYGKDADVSYSDIIPGYDGGFSP